MKKKYKYIYISCGGSGGHIVPGLAVASLISEKSKYNLVIVGIKRPSNLMYFKDYIKKNPKKENEYYIMPDNRIRRDFGEKNIILKKIYVFFNFSKYMIKLTKDVIFLKKKFHEKPPFLIIGFGSYASFPVILAGYIFRKCKIIIHEQNVRMGYANMFMLPLADEIVLSFAGSLNHIKKIENYPVFKFYYLFMQIFKIKKRKLKDKISVLGNPSCIMLRKESKTSCSSTLNLLVTGGSQGSSFLNYVISEILGNLISVYDSLKKISITHITGKGSVASVKSVYAKFNVKSYVKDYCFNMDEIYNKTDLIISRAGATTLSEICFFKLSAVLVPYRYASGHQKDNALYLEEKKAAVIIEEGEDKKNIFEKLKELLLNQAERHKLAENLSLVYPENAKENFIRFFKAKGCF